MPTALFLAFMTFLADTAAPADSPGDPAGAAAAPGGGGTFQMLISLGLIFGVMDLLRREAAALQGKRRSRCSRS